MALVAAALARGGEVEWLHVWVGYAIAALVAFRVIWGFGGSKHARFSDFLRPPSEVIRFIGQSLTLRAPRALGHNPAGGAMIVAMLALIALISATGFMLTTDLAPKPSRTSMRRAPTRWSCWSPSMSRASFWRASSMARISSGR